MLTDRSISDKEIAVLKQNLARLDKRESFQIYFLVAWVVLAIIVGLYFYFKPGTTYDHLLIVGIAVIYVLIGVWTFVEMFRKLYDERKSIKYVLNANKVRSVKVISTEYIELTESEDEGFFYFFQLPDNKILSFGGQNFYPTEDFPSDNFEIAICYGEKREIVLLETYVEGKRIYPKIKISERSKIDLIWSRLNLDTENFSIMDGQLEKIEAILLGK